MLCMRLCFLCRHTNVPLLTNSSRFKDQMWQKVATEMGIPWRSAESMHWQLGEQEMNARANTPVFQLHPLATSLGSPPTARLTPASVPPPGPPTPGFTPANVPQLIPHPPPLAPMQQQHQRRPPPPPPQPAAPNSPCHQRNESGSSQGRRRSSSLGQRRIEVRPRSTVPPPLGPNLPQVHPQSKADLIGGALTAPMPESPPSLKREDEMGLGESFRKRRRKDEDCSNGGLRAKTI